jgi:hypothetical protein
MIVELTFFTAGYPLFANRYLVRVLCKTSSTVTRTVNHRRTECLQALVSVIDMLEGQHALREF